MVPGFNTDFKYRGETYHVQTEDNGTGNPVVVTLLYHKGAILASRRTSYRDLLATPGFEERLRTLMKSQHKDLMRELLAGSFDREGAAPAVAGGSGEHPAEAAAAIATPSPVEAPAAASPAAQAPVVVSAAPAPPAAARVVAPAPAPPPAKAGPAPAAAPRPAAETLDEAIMRYLAEFAATAGAR